MPKHRLTIAIALGAALMSGPAMAYVGPGAGLSLLSALWGLLMAVGAAVGFVVLWPIRRWRRRRQAAVEARRAEDPRSVQGTSPAAAGERDVHDE